MEAPRATDERRLGHAIALAGAVAFAVSCFLPYSDVSLPMETDMSLFRLYVVLPDGAMQTAGGVLYLFPGIVTIALISVAGVRRPSRGTAVVLGAVTVVWAAVWIGAFLSSYELFESTQLYGYWLVLASVGVVVLGSVVAWATRGSGGKHEAGTPKPTAGVEPDATTPP